MSASYWRSCPSRSPTTPYCLTAVTSSVAPIQPLRRRTRRCPLRDCDDLIPGRDVVRVLDRRGRSTYLGHPPVRATGVQRRFLIGTRPLPILPEPGAIRAVSELRVVGARRADSTREIADPPRRRAVLPRTLRQHVSVGVIAQPPAIRLTANETVQRRCSGRRRRI